MLQLAVPARHQFFPGGNARHFLAIAHAAGIAPGLVHYHFASKEQILVEGLTRFTDELLEEVRAGIPAKGDTNGIARLITNLAGWARRNRSFATVYFVNSVGLNPLVEARRRSTRIELIELLQQAARNVHGRLRPAQAAVMAVALVLPYSPLSGLFEFVPLPAHLLLSLLGVSLAYGITVEVAKHSFYRRQEKRHARAWGRRHA